MNPPKAIEYGGNFATIAIIIVAIVGLFMLYAILYKGDSADSAQLADDDAVAGSSPRRDNLPADLAFLAGYWEMPKEFCDLSGISLGAIYINAQKAEKARGYCLKTYLAMVIDGDTTYEATYDILIGRYKRCAGGSGNTIKADCTIMNNGQIKAKEAEILPEKGQIEAKMADGTLRLFGPSRANLGDDGADDVSAKPRQKLYILAVKNNIVSGGFVD